MLNISDDTVCRLIELAQEFHAQEAVVIPEEPDSPSGDWARQMLEQHAGDQTVSEFKSIIDDLEPDQQHELVALFWIGRDDFTKDEWLAAVKMAREESSPETAEYLIAHPLVADYLREGLELFGKSCE